MHVVRLLLTCGLISGSGLACAGEIDGRALTAWWGLPFAGMLLSIALLPLLLPRLLLPLLQMPL